MGNGLSPTLQKLLEERKILRIRRDPALIAKEIGAAKADLKDAKESIALKKSKWATIQGYYAMFHSARALLYEKGFREKSHHALLVAVRELYVNEIERSLIQEFEHGMYLRQEADYGLKFSGRGAQDVIDIAEKMLERTKSILKLR
ncbi:MAG: HEPN domain-containing protein [Deltaproteobacteria bacterium]|nr:HEPN domain-containing protein [Deltaproteobacteria bacterium]